MIKEFKKYDKRATKTTVVPISELNEIFKASGRSLVLLTRYEEAFKNCKMSSRSDENVPHQVIAGNVLGIRIIDWEWSNDGYSVVITYEKERTA